MHIYTYALIGKRNIYTSCVKLTFDKDTTVGQEIEFEVSSREISFLFFLQLLDISYHHGDLPLAITTNIDTFVLLPT